MSSSHNTISAGTSLSTLAKLTRGQNVGCPGSRRHSTFFTGTQHCILNSRQGTLLKMLEFKLRLGNQSLSNEIQIPKYFSSEIPVTFFMDAIVTA